MEKRLIYEEERFPCPHCCVWKTDGVHISMLPDGRWAGIWECPNCQRSVHRIIEVSQPGYVVSDLDNEPEPLVFGNESELLRWLRVLPDDEEQKRNMAPIPW